MATNRGIGLEGKTPWQQEGIFLAANMQHFQHMVMNTQTRDSLHSKNEKCHKNSAIIMGRVTHNNTPHAPVPGCAQYVLTSSPQPSLDPFLFFMRSIDACIGHACDPWIRSSPQQGARVYQDEVPMPSVRDLWIVGGESVYRQFLIQRKYPLYDLWITRVQNNFDSDRFMPPFEHLFRRVLLSYVPQADPCLYQFERWIPRCGHKQRSPLLSHIQKR